MRAAVQSLRRCADEDAGKIETGTRTDTYTHTHTHHISSCLGRREKQRETIYCADKGWETPAALKRAAEERKRESATAVGDHLTSQPRIKMREGISGISPTHRSAINIKRCPNTNKRRVRAPLNLDFTTCSALNPACTCAVVTGGDQEGDSGGKSAPW